MHPFIFMTTCLPLLIHFHPCWLQIENINTVLCTLNDEKFLVLAGLPSIAILLQPKHDSVLTDEHCCNFAHKVACRKCPEVYCPRFTGWLCNSAANRFQRFRAQKLLSRTSLVIVDSPLAKTDPAGFTFQDTLCGD